MTQPIVFLGSNSNITVYVDICERNGIPIAGIIDSDYYGNTEQLHGLPVISSDLTADWTALKTQYNFFVATNSIPGTGRRDRRQHFIDLVHEHCLPCANIIDPDSRIVKTAVLGQGIFVGYTAIISAGTHIGNHSQIHFRAGIGHDCTLDENSVIQRGAILGSHIHVCSGAYVGIDARILAPSGARIGVNSVIHPGLTILRDVADHEIVSLAGSNTRKIYDRKTVE